MASLTFRPWPSWPANACRRTAGSRSPPILASCAAVTWTAPAPGVAGRDRASVRLRGPPVRRRAGRRHGHDRAGASRSSGAAAWAAPPSTGPPVQARQTGEVGPVPLTADTEALSDGAHALYLAAGPVAGVRRKRHAAGRHGHATAARECARGPAPVHVGAGPARACSSRSTRRRSATAPATRAGARTAGWTGSATTTTSVPPGRFWPPWAAPTPASSWPTPGGWIIQVGRHARRPRPRPRRRARRRGRASHAGGRPDRHHPRRQRRQPARRGPVPHGSASPGPAAAPGTPS